MRLVLIAPTMRCSGEAPCGVDAGKCSVFVCCAQLAWHDKAQNTTGIMSEALLMRGKNCFIRINSSLLVIAEHYPCATRVDYPGFYPEGFGRNSGAVWGGRSWREQMYSNKMALEKMRRPPHSNGHPRPIQCEAFFTEVSITTNSRHPI